jgi:hypothetical protein
MASGLCRPVSALPTKYRVVRGLASGQFRLARIPDSRHAFNQFAGAEQSEPKGDF